MSVYDEAVQPDLTVEAVLTRAAELIDERGWGQGWFITGDGCLCAAGAIGVAVGGNPGDRDPGGNGWTFPDTAASSLFHRGWEAVAQELHRQQRGRSLASWNDSPGRTAEEVKALLLAAAEASRG